MNKIVDKNILDRMFGSDEAMGVMFWSGQRRTQYGLKERQQMGQELGSNMPDLVSLLPGGGSAVVCTSYAEHIANALPGRVELAGFHCQDIPDCGFSRDQLAEGHDFALVDGRYLVDPWPRLVVGDDTPVVFDFQHPPDAEYITSFYGDRDQWSVSFPTEPQKPFTVQLLDRTYRFISEFDAVEIESMVVDPLDSTELALAIDYPDLPARGFSVRLHLLGGGTETICEFRANDATSEQLHKAEQGAVRLALELGAKIIATDPFLTRSHVLGAGLHRETTVVTEFIAPMKTDSVESNAVAANIDLAM